MLKSAILTAALSSALVVGVATAQQQQGQTPDQQRSGQQQQQTQTPDQQPTQQHEQHDIQADRVEGQDRTLAGNQDDFGPMTAENVLNKLYQASVKEIAMGNLAQEKGSSSRVQDFGEQLVEDHKASAKRVKEVARAQNIQIHQMSSDDERWNPVGDDESVRDETTVVETEETRVGVRTDADLDQKEHVKMAKDKFRVHYQRLHELEDEQFDDEFLAMMEQEHEMLLNKLQEAEQQVDNEEVKQLIAQTRPVLSEHQEIAQRIQSELETAQRTDAETRTQQN